MAGAYHAEPRWATGAARALAGRRLQEGAHEAVKKVIKNRPRNGGGDDGIGYLFPTDEYGLAGQKMLRCVFL